VKWEKIFSIHPKLLINAEHYGLGPKAEKGYHHIWEANLQRETTRPLPPPHRPLSGALSWPDSPGQK